MLLGQFKLMTEMFHLTHSALHTGLTSTIQHYNKLLRYVNMFRMNVSVDTSVDIVASTDLSILDRYSVYVFRSILDR